MKLEGYRGFIAYFITLAVGVVALFTGHATFEQFSLFTGMIAAAILGVRGAGEWIGRGLKR